METQNQAEIANWERPFETIGWIALAGKLDGWLSTVYLAETLSIEANTRWLGRFFVVEFIETMIWQLNCDKKPIKVMIHIWVF